MARYVPDKGDIVPLDFDPSAGNEIIKRRPALVISRQSFNDHTGFSIVAPITNTVRGMALEIPLQGTATNGVVLMYQLRSLDVASRAEMLGRDKGYYRILVMCRKMSEKLLIVS